ncbi:MAG: SDR family NAD(P)-dependent oxidoreductase [Alphaproteobacteria bacterium]|nr:SDR family NAD(P)-dependent oxidoreductase [Alphaproteobacteria bacterium]
MTLLPQTRAIVTGAGRKDGIGWAVAQLFIQNGAQVILLDLDQDSVHREAIEIGALAGIGCDVSDQAAVRDAVDEAEALLGGLDCVVNSAGIVNAARLHQITDTDWHRMIDVNLGGTFNLLQAAIPALTKGINASFVAISSMAAMRGGGLLGSSHYAASKAGILGLVKGAARELGPAKIRVNALAPGIVDTSMTRGKFGPDWEKMLLDQIPLGRFASPEDIAKACLFLASDLSCYMTGVTLDVNGGYFLH